MKDFPVEQIVDSGSESGTGGSGCSGRSATTLADLKKNQKATILKCSATGALGQKLMNMGFVPGTEVLMVRNAPLRDPIEIEIHGYLVTLRQTEAALIQVEFV